MYPKVYLDLYNVCFGNPGKIYFITGLPIDLGVSCSSGDDPTYYGEITIER